MSLEASAQHDQACGSLQPGWHPHPEYATVERYWDGAGWTGEHRFAASQDAVPAVAALDDGASSALNPETLLAFISPTALLSASFVVPFLYVAIWLAVQLDSDCLGDSVLGLALGLGAAMTLATTAGAFRATRLLGMSGWARLLTCAACAVHCALAVLDVAFVLGFSCITFF